MKIGQKQTCTKHMHRAHLITRSDETNTMTPFLDQTTATVTGQVTLS